MSDVTTDLPPARVVVLHAGGKVTVEAAAGHITTLDLTGLKPKKREGWGRAVFCSVFVLAGLGLLLSWNHIYPNAAPTALAGSTDGPYPSKVVETRQPAPAQPAPQPRRIEVPPQPDTAEGATDPFGLRR